MNHKEVANHILAEVKSSVRFEGGEDYSEVEVETNRAGKVVITLTVGAVDRGPRQDHGGGEDGDDWMDDHQVSHYEEEFFTKNKPVADKVERIIKSHLGESFTMDYGEKRHITIYFYMTEA